MTGGLSFVAASRRFGDQRALACLDLECQVGELTCLVGHNGAGKSTALALAAGLLAATSGRILVFGREIELETPPASTGYLPQHSSFHRSLRVSEVIEFTLAARNATDAHLAQALEVTGLKEGMKRFVGELSGGWVRRLGLLSALLGSPDLLLLDEPFVGLDPETHDRLLEHLEQRRSAGATIVMASHDFEAVDPFGPRVVVFNEGRLLSTEKLPANGAGSSRSTYRRALGGAPLAAVRSAV